MFKKIDKIMGKQFKYEIVIAILSGIAGAGLAIEYLCPITCIQ